MCVPAWEGSNKPTPWLHRIIGCTAWCRCGHTRLFPTTLMETKWVDASLMRNYGLMLVEWVGCYWLDVMCTNDRMYLWCFLSEVLVHRRMFGFIWVCSFTSSPILWLSPFHDVIRVQLMSHSVYVRNYQLLFIHPPDQQLNQNQLKRRVFVYNDGCLHPVSGPLGKNTTSEETEGWWSTASPLLHSLIEGMRWGHVGGNNCNKDAA